MKAYLLESQNKDEGFIIQNLCNDCEQKYAHQLEVSLERFAPNCGPNCYFCGQQTSEKDTSSHN